METGKRNCGKNTECKAEIEKLKLAAEKAEREGDYGKVAEIRYGKVKEQEKIIEELTNQLTDSTAKNDC